MFIKSLTLHEWYRGHSYRFRFSPSSGRHGRSVVAWYGTTPSQITLWTCGGTCAFITAHPLRSWRRAHRTKLCIIYISRWMSIMLGLGSWFKSQSMAQNQLRKTINVLFLHFATSIHVVRSKECFLDKIRFGRRWLSCYEIWNHDIIITEDSQVWAWHSSNGGGVINDCYFADKIKTMTVSAAESLL